MSGENLSRSELLHWVNSLCHLQHQRLEELGNGIAYCIILDSIFEDVPLRRLKWNGNQEVDYLQNFRILQSEFAKHKIDKPIPVQKLAKLTLAPNLEFLQWLRKFWVQRFPDDKHYDAAGRRGGVGAEGAAPAAIAGVTRMESASSVHTVVGQDSESASHPPASKETKRPAKPSLPLATKGSSSGTPLAKLTAEIAQLKGLNEAALTERDFYWSKLREVEILMQTKNQLKEDGRTLSSDLQETLSELENILYATAEGFEVPQGEEYLR